MSVIIRLQNLPWSANALDIRNYFRGLSIPEGGVHIVGGELGDAFIAFSTDEDARQAMMLNCGKIKEIQVKLLLSSRSEMHKVIEAARQTVPILSLAPIQTPVPAVQPTSTPTVIPPVQQNPVPPTITPFSAALGANPLSSFGIPGLGNPQEIPQPAVIELPAPLISPDDNTTNVEEGDEDKSERKRSREKDRRRTRSRSRSRDRDRKDRKRDRRDRSRSRDRRRRDRSRSRDRRDRKRDRKDRSRSRDRSPSRRSRDRRPNERRSPGNSQEKIIEIPGDIPLAPMPPTLGNINPTAPTPTLQQLIQANVTPNGPSSRNDSPANRFNDPSLADTYSKLQELGKKRNPNAFQGEQQNGAGSGAGKFQGARGGMSRGGTNNRRDGRVSRFESDQQRDCCVALRNAPNHTSYGDVRRFFPYLIDKHGIKMINDTMGRRTGNIYVRFCDARSRQLALQRKSNELKGANVIVEALDDDLYDNAVDSFLPYREDNDEEEQTLIIADEDVQRPPFSVLKLSELPHFIKEHDIIKTFSDFSLLSIMLQDCRITRSKVAFVQFVKPEDARIAFDQREKYVFGRRQAVVVPVTNEEYEKEKLSQGDKPAEAKRPPVIEPPQENTAPRDPRQRRQQFDNGSGPQAGPPVQGGPQGAPFFAGPFVQQQGFPAPFGGPQFGGFPGPGAMDPRTAATNWANRPPFPNQMEPMPGNMMKPKAISTDLEDEPLDCVLMKGLPRDATDRTIVTFLSDTGAVPARIHLMLDANGLPSGDCFCEFRSSQEARMAATKHGNNLDGCRVTVDLVPRGVVEEALEGPKQPEIQEGLLGNGPPQFFDQSMRGGFAARGGNGGGFRGRGGFDRGGFDRGGYNRGGFDQNRGGFDQSRGGFDQSRGGFDHSRGSYRGRGGFDRGSRGGFDRGRGRGFNRGRGGGGGGGGYENGMVRNEEEQDPALDDFGAPGCVVSMENVPFRASIDDIMNFFAEFDLTQDDVIRRYNERGQPTGDARVAFRTPFDAQRAVKTRHMDMIYDRRISLCIL